MRRIVYALMVIALSVAGASMGAHHASADAHPVPITAFHHLDDRHQDEGTADDAGGTAHIVGDDGCAGCAPQHDHGLLVMACVFLAVLVTAFLIRATATPVVAELLAPEPQRRDPGQPSAVPSKPDLHQLCISRQ